MPMKGTKTKNPTLYVYVIRHNISQGNRINTKRSKQQVTQNEINKEPKSKNKKNSAIIYITTILYIKLRPVGISCFAIIQYIL